MSTAGRTRRSNLLSGQVWGFEEGSKWLVKVSVSLTCLKSKLSPIPVEDRQSTSELSKGSADDNDDDDDDRSSDGLKGKKFPFLLIACDAVDLRGDFCLPYGAGKPIARPNGLGFYAQA